VDVRLPSFVSVAAGVPFSEDLEDVSMGWDGTLWGLTNKATSCAFDPVGQTRQGGRVVERRRGRRCDLMKCCHPIAHVSLL
jgi:hypothetical protein